MMGGMKYLVKEKIIRLHRGGNEEQVKIQRAKKKFEEYLKS